MSVVDGASPALRPELAKTEIRMDFDGFVLFDAVVTLGKLADVTIQIAPEARTALQSTRYASPRFLYITFEDTLLRMVAHASMAYQVVDDHTVRIVPLRK